MCIILYKVMISYLGTLEHFRLNVTLRDTLDPTLQIFVKEICGTMDIIFGSKLPIWLLYTAANIWYNFEHGDTPLGGNETG